MQQHEKKYMNYVVYLHRNPITNIVFYVGVGNSVRPYNFRSRSPRWKNYVNKYGIPIVEIYKTNLLPHEAFQIEIYLINLLGRRGKEGYGQLLNHSIGGDCGSRGMVTSSETKLKQSLAKKGRKLSPEHLANLNKFKPGKEHRLYGTKVSDETRLKQSLAKRGKITAFAKKVVNTETGEIYPSGAFVARMIGRNVNNFVSSLRGVPSRPNRTVYKYL